MSSKSRVRKHTQPAMSPLLRALTYSRTAHEPVTMAMLMQCYTALDAFRRGRGSRDLHMTLSRHLLVSQELARLGLGEDVLADIESAHAAMVQLDAREHQDGTWILDDGEYRRLCTALAILDGQLSAASLSEIANAEAKMIEGLMRSARAQALVEATV
ncbi:hypothetical protein R69927_05587 [Paraburkholderia domus]|jgi:hypothetical protein|uniref:Uncharacterized protein n=1 Tax=Paraburkholderia domus TaxID=2793075 RepID=A0A9N8N956_9BURK|nr:hypothetical protein [Paraburkholderia domus]MBK5065351.1 hypothetical protein [Burkholderia sp. R-70199]MBK5089743.1 hypothetical protein [Burkholderia sp. R-69927]MBK5124441.1 hypothetical protein [Burkholderia sp. R-69980]MBK5168801.1 hypothetical protein [Burkholderia sp. R-70211]MBK5184111.1 hypothetical protein [Burkholderia sp. R-69749]MCI0147716.1 hypothetical protein [Paraburkholderia sediminicola]